MLDQNIKFEYADEGTKNNPVRNVTATELDNVITRRAKNALKKEMILLRRVIISNLISELRKLPPSKHYVMLNYKTGENARIKPLREEIIDAIQKDNDITKDGVWLSGGKYTMEIVIKHPLAIALNDGTGIYGPEKRPIVSKGYMFIPGERFMHSYYSRREKKAGYNSYGQYTSGIKTDPHGTNTKKV